MKDLLDKCEADLRNAGDTSPLKKQEPPKTSNVQEEKQKEPIHLDKSYSEGAPVNQSSGQPKLKKKNAPGSFEPEETLPHKPSSSSAKDTYNIYEEAKKSTSDTSTEKRAKEPTKADVVIEEEERKEPYRPPKEETKSSNTSAYPGVDEEKIKMAKEGLKNMVT